MRVGSTMFFVDTHALSSGPYPSQSTRYWRPRRRTAKRRLTVYTGPPSMILRGGGGLVGGTNGLSKAGLIRDTWKVGCTLIDLGSLSRTAAGLMILETGDGPMNRGANLRDSTHRGMSRVDSQTLLPGWYVGAGVRRRSAAIFVRTELLRRTSRTPLQTRRH